MTVDYGGLVASNRIGEVRDFDFPFRTHPTSESIDALMRVIEHVSSDHTIERSSSPLRSVGETIQLAIDHATNVLI